MLHQDMSQNVPLQPGDTLFIPEDVSNKIYVVGDVNHPGVFPLKGRLTVLQAIAMAGGPTQHGLGTAKTARIVRRTDPGAPDVTASTTGGSVQSVQKVGDHGVVMTVDLRQMTNGDLSKDEPLRAGDVVVVPETGLSALPLILQVIGTIFLGLHF
jgi:polysaccharide export outer membrane protein